MGRFRSGFSTIYGRLTAHRDPADNGRNVPQAELSGLAVLLNLPTWP
jgi:hypothetical protein